MFWQTGIDFIILRQQLHEIIQSLIQQIGTQQIITYDGFTQMMSF